MDESSDLTSKDNLKAISTDDLADEELREKLKRQTLINKINGEKQSSITNDIDEAATSADSEVSDVGEMTELSFQTKMGIGAWSEMKQDD